MTLIIEKDKGKITATDPDQPELGPLVFSRRGTISFPHKKDAVSPAMPDLYDYALAEFRQRGINWHPAESLNPKLEEELQTLYEDPENGITLGTDNLDQTRLWAIFNYFGHISRDCLGNERNVIIGGVKSYKREYTKRTHFLHLELQEPITIQYAYVKPGRQVLNRIIPGTIKNNSSGLLTLTKEKINGHGGWRNVKARFIPNSLLQSVFNH